MSGHYIFGWLSASLGFWCGIAFANTGFVPLLFVGAGFCVVAGFMAERGRN